MRYKETLQNLLCAVLVTVVFSIRWGSCLPFSGKMPILTNIDHIGFFGRYIIFTKEPLGFPLGLIRNIAFPFCDGNINRGTLPLFGILFKLLSRIYAPFSEFYYFIFVELLSVFMTVYLACLILETFKVRSFWIKLLGAVLTGLSFALLYRSSNYFSYTFIVAGFPIYLAFAYFYIKIYKKPNWESLILLALVFPVAALTDYYLFFGILFLAFVCLCLNALEVILREDPFKKRGLVFIMGAFILGIFLSNMAFFILGNQGNLELTPERYIFKNRYDTEWGYGGGFGGGFHVADALSVFIPPEDNKNVPDNRWCGQGSYLKKLGFPITQNNLQDGQYEGFAYVGTITIGILLFLLMANFLSFVKNYRKYFVRLKLRVVSNLFMLDEFFSLPLILGLSAFSLYMISWGYIIHIAGVRFNNIVTPSLILAIIWPKFMIARAVGRTSIPFALFIIIGTVVLLSKFSYSYLTHSGKSKRIFFNGIIILLIALHIYEIKGYLVQPKAVFGNDFANVFGKRDLELIEELSQSKKAVMIVPQVCTSSSWDKICYALAFYSGLPMSGTTIGYGEPRWRLRQYNQDQEAILTGRTKEIIDKYGQVIIASPPDMAEKIFTRSDMPLDYHKLHNQEVALLTFKK